MRIHFTVIMKVLYDAHTLHSHTINQHFSLKLLGFLMDIDSSKWDLLYNK